MVTKKKGSEREDVLAKSPEPADIIYGGAGTVFLSMLKTTVYLLQQDIEMLGIKLSAVSIADDVVEPEFVSFKEKEFNENMVHDFGVALEKEVLPPFFADLRIAIIELSVANAQLQRFINRMLV